MERTKDTALYDGSADGWWDKNEKFYALRLLNTPRFVFFDRLIEDFRGLKVLDVGCGGGFTAEFLAERGALVTGIDPSAGLIGVAKKHAEAGGLAINYLQVSGEQIALPDGEFDVVICVDVLEHVQDVTKVIHEIYRLLKPGGVFLFDTINRTFKSRWVMIWLLENIVKAIPKGVHTYRKFIKPDELEKMLTEAGFSNILLRGLSIKGQDHKGTVAELPRMECWLKFAELYLAKSGK